MTAQLPAESYAEVRAGLEARARQFPSDGETRWDQRLADAFVVSVVRRGDRATGPSHRSIRGRAVARAPTSWWRTCRSPRSSTRTRTWPASSSTAGLVDAEVMRRLACDATLVVALDDDVGHTMYEGRARRDPTPTQRRELWRRDRHCRFPGCTNATFVNPHHMRWWRRDRGPTDLDNLALLCEHHHHLVHSKRRLSGDANAELSFVGPSAGS